MSTSVDNQAETPDTESKGKDTPAEESSNELNVQQPDFSEVPVTVSESGTAMEPVSYTHLTLPTIYSV